MTPLLWGQVFQEIARDDDLFAKVEVDPQTGTITWPNGADLDPDVLHGDFERRIRCVPFLRRDNARTMAFAPPLNPRELEPGRVVGERAVVVGGSRTQNGSGRTRVKPAQ
ncbi:MAG: DUF2442 domain-containing protein [Acidimicrobiia bacterium]